MVTCPHCQRHVSHVLLRTDTPTCPNDHPLGHWVACGNRTDGPHIYLHPTHGTTCPVCHNPSTYPILRGSRVRCLHHTPDHRTCPAPHYTWLIDGPPCYMNHLTEIRLETPATAALPTAVTATPPPAETGVVEQD